MKRLKNIEDKNEKQLKPVKDQGKRQLDSKNSKAAGSKSFLIYDSRHGFYKYRLSEFVKISSIESKFDALEILYKDFINLKNVDAKPENISHKFIGSNNASTFCGDLTKEYKNVYERDPKDDKNNNWKQKYDRKNLKNLEYQSVKSNVKPLSERDKSDLKQLMQLKQLRPYKIQKPLWVELPNKDFSSLIKDVANSLDDDNYKTTVNNHWYYLKNAEKFLLEIATRKNSKNEGYEMYNDLIKGDIAALTKAKSRGKDKS